MNGLTIVGLCLLAPLTFVFVALFIVNIINSFKNSNRSPLKCNEDVESLLLLIGIVGLILIGISIS
jgi:predicted branched-subunit amino acid permease